MAYHDNDGERFYYHCYYQLLRKRAKLGESYVVRMDHRTTRRKDRLSDLKMISNRGIRKELGISHDMILDIQPRPSKNDDILQAVDVLLGAIGFHFAGGHRKDRASMAKCALADRFCQRLGVRSLGLASPSPNDGPVNNWVWQPSKG